MYFRIDLFDFSSRIIECIEQRWIKIDPFVDPRFKNYRRSKSLQFSIRPRSDQVPRWNDRLLLYFIFSQESLTRCWARLKQGTL